MFDNCACAKRRPGRWRLNKSDSDHISEELAHGDMEALAAAMAARLSSIGFLGSGKMATAMARGFISAGEIIICNANYHESLLQLLINYTTHTYTAMYIHQLNICYVIFRSGTSRKHHRFSN